MRGSWWMVAVGLAVAAGGCDGADEVTCQVVVNEVTVCLDLNDTKYCEKDLGGTAANAELEPGGPYAYCEDVLTVVCEGSTIVVEGEGVTAEYPYTANSTADCLAADGGTITTN